MDEVIYYTSLYDHYSGLLTEKQRTYFEDYYFQNLTLSEMSENYGISRNAIHKQIKETCEKLQHYETILKLKEKQEKINNLAMKIEEEKLKQELLNIL